MIRVLSGLTIVTLYGNISWMSKIRRGNYIFVTWIADHAPRHVHVYKDGKLVVKWDLDNHLAVEGKASRRILKLIAELEQEGRL